MLRAEDLEETQLCHRQSLSKMETPGGLEGGASVSDIREGWSRRTFWAEESISKTARSVLISVRQDSWNLGSNKESNNVLVC